MSDSQIVLRLTMRRQDSRVVLLLCCAAAPRQPKCMCPWTFPQPPRRVFYMQQMFSTKALLLLLPPRRWCACLPRTCPLRTRMSWRLPPLCSRSRWWRQSSEWWTARCMPRRRPSPEAIPMGGWWAADIRLGIYGTRLLLLWEENRWIGWLCSKVNTWAPASTRAWQGVLPEMVLTTPCAGTRTQP